MRPPLWRDALALAGIITLILGLALALAWPWRSQPTPGGALLERYAPLSSGQAALRVTYDAGGTLLLWESPNVVILPILDAATDPRAGLWTVIDQFHPWREATSLPGFEVVEVRLLSLDAAGAVRETVEVILREERGQFLVGRHDLASDRDLRFDPPLQLLPGHLVPGRHWQSAGQLSHTGRYRATSQVLEKGSLPAEPGTFADCLRVETSLVLSQAGTQTQETLRHDRYCSGIGLVESRWFSPDGALTARSVIASAPGVQPSPALFPLPAGAVGEDIPAGDPGDWRLTRFGHVLPPSKHGAATIPPTWISSDPPLLLAANYYNGDLVAFDSTGAMRWRFCPEGTIYGQPALDAQRGRLYFGASDGWLYALDSRGFFLWSFRTDDNVAMCPLVTDDILVFGSEDRSIYALEAETGTVRWTAATGGAVVSSPALAGDLVLVGSDDGSLHALDLAAGQQRWLCLREAAVVAPIVVEGDTASVASRDGSVSAVDPADGTARWVADIGPALRTAPAVGRDALSVVDSGGTLTALSRATGNPLWITREAGYVGPPVLVGGTLVVARNDGSIVRLGLDGKERGRRRAADVSLPGDATPAFYLGPSLGGGAIWLIDEDSVVYRLVEEG